VVAFALVLAATYGAGSQFLGARVSGWGPEVAQLSAPWLAIAFLAGATQREPRRAALLGLACTAAALVGYWLMTDSPLEGAQYTLANARGFLVSNERVIIGGILTGPLFGWFGQQWRTRRMLAGALLIAAAFCFEPLARWLNDNPVRGAPVIVVEVAAGLLLAVVVLARHREGLRSGD
jgi:hypothetical protein